MSYKDLNDTKDKLLREISKIKKRLHSQKNPQLKNELKEKERQLKSLSS